MDDNLRQISDGHLYNSRDLVKVGCHDCEGCSICCQGMGNSILLDPYDICRLSEGLHKSFNELLENEVELHVEKGLILPNLKMKGMNGLEQCSFLNTAGRCQIHSIRPGICRLFPLGRNYDGDTLNYFLLLNECPATNKTKIRVSKWLEQDNLKTYERYLVDWHNLTKRFRNELSEMDDEEQIKSLSMIFLQLFYINPYSSLDNFYTEFYERVKKLE